MRARGSAGLLLAIWLSLGCAAPTESAQVTTEVPAATTSIPPSTTTSSSQTSTTTAGPLALPPRQRGPGFGGYVQGVAFAGTYATTVFEPSLSFTLQDTWETGGEDSSKIFLWRRAGISAGCSGDQFCNNWIVFTGTETLRYVGVDPIGFSKEGHPQFAEVGEAVPVTVAQVEGTQLDVVLTTDEAVVVPDLGLVSGPEGWPDVGQKYPGGQVRLISLEVEEEPILISITSPSTRGFEEFLPIAQAVLDTVEFSPGV